jgi:hypothetical protein
MLTQVFPAHGEAGIHSVRERYFAPAQEWRKVQLRKYLRRIFHVATQQLGLQKAPHGANAKPPSQSYRSASGSVASSS